MGKRIQALSAERRPGIAPDGADRRWIVEALAGAVVVDDGDGGRVAAGGERQQRREEERDAHQCG
jgi:hypothetical protein